MGIRGAGIGLAVAVAAGFAVAGVATAAGGGAWHWALPPGFSAPSVPARNPMSAAKVALGRRLFYDGRLSVGGTMSCATCHEQHRAFASATVTHPGIGGNPGLRNVPGLANVGWLPALTWHDPNITTLEAQAMVPMFGMRPVEMGARPGELLKRLEGDACYRRMFRAADPAGGGAISLVAIANALAAFQRTLISYQSPYDAWRRGDKGVLSPAALRGQAVFARACAACHAGSNFTDGRFHRIEPVDPESEDRGAAEATGDPADEGRFRTAPLRNVAITAPYFHDGAARTIEAAIRRHRLAGGDALPEGDVADVSMFLETFTDHAFTKNPDFSRPQGCEVAGRL